MTRVNTANIVVLTVIVLLVLSFVDAIFQQTQLILSTPRFVSGNSAFKILLLIATCLLIYTCNLKLRPIVYPYLVFVIYVLIDFFSMILNQKINLSDFLLSIFTYYFFIIIALILHLFPKSNKRIINMKIFKIIYITLLLIGIFQGLENDPVLFTESPDQSFKINSWGFYDKVRSFSVFTSPANFGHYIAIATPVIVVHAIKTKQIASAIMYLIIGSFGTYLTLTRATYIEFILTIFTLSLIFILERYKNVLKNVFLITLPLIYASITIVFTLYSSSRVKYSSGYNLFSEDTLNLRTIAWKYYWKIFTSGSINEMLFGTGYIQNDKSNIFVGMPIDNLFLAILLNIGLIGTILFLGIYAAIWIYINSKVSQKNYNFYALHAYWSTFVATSIFGVNTNNYIIALSFVLLLKYHPNYKKGEQPYVHNML